MDKNGHKVGFGTHDVIGSFYCHLQLRFLKTHFPGIHMILSIIQSVRFQNDKINLEPTMPADGRPLNGHHN